MEVRNGGGEGRVRRMVDIKYRCQQHASMVKVLEPTPGQQPE